MLRGASSGTGAGPAGLRGRAGGRAGGGVDIGGHWRASRKPPAEGARGPAKRPGHAGRPGWGVVKGAVGAGQETRGRASLRSRAWEWSGVESGGAEGSLLRCCSASPRSSLQEAARCLWAWRALRGG